MSFKPIKNPKPKRHTITCRMTDPEITRLRCICHNNNIGLSTLIMQMVRHCLFEMDFKKEDV